MQIQLTPALHVQNISNESTKDGSFNPRSASSPTSSLHSGLASVLDQTPDMSVGQAADALHSTPRRSTIEGAIFSSSAIEPPDITTAQGETGALDLSAVGDEDAAKHSTPRHSVEALPDFTSSAAAADQSQINVSLIAEPTDDSMVSGGDAAKHSTPRHSIEALADFSSSAADQSQIDASLIAEPATQTDDSGSRMPPVLVRPGLIEWLLRNVARKSD